ncbi:hypothetical protein Pcinc_019921 [Petrolisthes cinctipes]|uniref:Uncharacterized protein n=1 Tax=Petrolisthes cinctipes TaxID=88211 RepID=A0AAE1FK33_PETCI|nr:hypothetical protein Pcinc_019921 [Petrolisthes cinctipes]
MEDLQMQFELRVHLKDCSNISKSCTHTALSNVRASRSTNETNNSNVPLLQNFYATYSVVEPWFKLFSTVTFSDPIHLSIEDNIYITRGVARVEHWSHQGSNEWDNNPGEYSILLAPFSVDQ